MRSSTSKTYSPAKAGRTRVSLAGRPRKAKARKSRFTAEELEEYRQALLNKRRELIGDVTQLGNSTKSRNARSGDDGLSSGWELEFAFVVIDNKQSLLQEIDDALRRIQDKTYGFCVATNKVISRARLGIMPWAKHCLEHARRQESGLVRRHRS